MLSHKIMVALFTPVKETSWPQGWTHDQKVLTTQQPCPSGESEQPINTGLAQGFRLREKKEDLLHFW